MDTAENKELVYQYFEAFNTGNLGILDEILDVRFFVRGFHQKIEDVSEQERGPAHFKQAIQTWRASFPDANILVEEVVAEGDAVIVRWRMTGTHAGEFAGLPPTQKQISYSGVNGFLIAGGKLAEAWDLWDRLSLWQQLGVLPQTAIFLKAAREAQLSHVREGGDTLQRFTARARKVLSLAQAEAEKQSDSQIGTGHLLLALIREQGGVAGRALTRLGVTLERVQEQMDKIRPASPGADAPGHKGTSLGSDIKQALELGIDEARRMGNQGIETEHLLLGLLRCQQGIALQLIEGLGVTPQQIQAAIRQALDEPPDQP